MKHHIKQLALASIFAALIFVVTAYLPRIPVPPGYIHLGDAFIYIASCLLPVPYAAAAAAVGAAAADALTGYIQWAPGTLVIKAVMAVIIYSRKYKVFNIRNIVASAAAGLAGVAGYYIYEAALLTDFRVAIAGVPYNLVQAACSTVIFAVAAFALDRADIKKHTEKTDSSNI